MKPPIEQPSDWEKPSAKGDCKSERRHYDPPALWYAVILGSFAIHLSAFGMLRLLMGSGLIGMNASKELVPIDVVAIASRQPKGLITSNQPKTTTTQAPSKTNPKPTQNPSKTASTSSPKNIKSQTNTTKKPSNTNTKKSATTNSSKSSVKVQPNSKPTTSNNNQSSIVTPSPAPSRGNSPNSQSAGGFNVFPGKLELINNIDRLRPEDPNSNDQLASLVNSNTPVLSAQELKKLNVSLERDVELKVELIVETDGTARVLPTKVTVVRGSINQNKAIALASKIVEKLRFTPTKMAGGKVLGNYSLPLIIRPATK